jgi:hypothetical protein
MIIFQLRATMIGPEGLAGAAIWSSFGANAAEIG